MSLKKENYLVVFSFTEWWVLSMNLISEIHHSCERGTTHLFVVLNY